MTYVLNARERKLLDYLQIDHKSFQIRGQLPVGTGSVTLDRLTSLGLLETGAGRFGDTGWRLSDDGWRCIYGQTNGEIMAAGIARLPLKTWSWPPTADKTRAAARPSPRLTTLKPALGELAPRLSTLKPRD